MTIVKHELRMGRMSLAVWTGAIGFLLVICVMLYPEMKGDMESVNQVFSSMGSFCEAFGMDKVSFGSVMGFYAIECGNVLGIGGAFFAALCAAASLSKEEKEHTAEFLLTHPVSRGRIVAGKMVSVFLQVAAMNIVIFMAAVVSIMCIHEDFSWKEFTLLHLSYLLLQIEIAGICFGVSAALKNGSTGVGLGIAAVMYFLNIIANITDKAEFLKYITPFGYAEGTDIVTDGCIDTGYLIPGMIYCIAGIAAAYVIYCRKDIS
ncbi:MAG: ABC transporter permease subunit [Lentihominibacter sp.]|nr:ABC transporter permease subunit [Lentihominibacter sp.]